VCGGGALYCDGLSAAALAHAMERVAGDEKLRAELRQKGRLRVIEFQWEKTARETLAGYESALTSPSERSLRMRLLLHDVIIDWSDKSRKTPHDRVDQSLGIRDACRALEGAVYRRLRREFRRLRPEAAVTR